MMVSNVSDRGRLNLEPDIGFPTDTWARHRARFLDPRTAVKAPGAPQVRQTAYVSDTLLLRGADDEETFGTLRRVAKDAGFYVKRDSAASHRDLIDQVDLTDEQRAELSRLWIERVRLVPDREHEGLVRPEDAWHILQAYRYAVGESERNTDVALEHLVAATTTGIGGSPFTMSHGVGGSPFTMSHAAFATPFTMSHGLSSYVVPGRGGRQPVNWTGPEPHPRHPLDEPGDVRRPVVAVLDTGVGGHPWFEKGFIQRDVHVAGVSLDIRPSTPDSEQTGSTDRLVGALDPDAGHGTFIAGLIRQACPDAMVLAIRLFHGDGVVGEWDLLRALQLLTLRHALAMAGEDDYEVVDVVSLSLGYYHEQPSDVAYSSLLHEWLKLLGTYGVTVVASAGNDATERPMYPGAFSTESDSNVGVVPVVCVGAENPDKSVALFSNDGDWVGYTRPGAALVSTHPTSFDASLEPSVEVSHKGRVRSTIDLDDFSSGFAVWSGTSFAAPIFAGEFAARLLERYDGGDVAKDAAAARARAVKILEAMPKDSRPEPDPCSGGQP